MDSMPTDIYVRKASACPVLSSSVMSQTTRTYMHQISYNCLLVTCLITVLIRVFPILHWMSLISRIQLQSVKHD